jgi:hypothetical protein
VVKKGAEKILKYKDITFEIQHLWNAKANLIAVITGATGTISELPRQYLSNIPG